MKPVAFEWTKMKNIQKIHRVLYAIGLGPLVGRIILLLTTTGRRSGKKRVTPLQYEMIGNDYFLGAARGTHADWVRNILADPQVEIRVGTKQFQGRAEVVRLKMYEIIDARAKELRNEHDLLLQAM